MKELNFDLPKKKDTKVLKKVSEVRASTKGGYYFINFGVRHNFNTKFEAMVKRDELAKYKGLDLLYFPMKVTMPKLKTNEIMSKL